MSMGKITTVTQRDVRREITVDDTSMHFASTHARTVWSVRSELGKMVEPPTLSFFPFGSRRVFLSSFVCF